MKGKLTESSEPTCALCRSMVEQMLRKTENISQFQNNSISEKFLKVNFFLPGQARKLYYKFLTHQSPKILPLGALVDFYCHVFCR